MRLDRQHQRVACDVLRGDATDASDYFHRYRENLLWQALSGFGVRSLDGSDRWRFRRRDGKSPGDLQSARHLLGQQRQSFSPRGSKNRHVPRARGLALGGTRLDRRSRGEFGQQQRVWKSIHRAQGTGIDFQGAEIGSDQRSGS